MSVPPGAVLDRILSPITREVFFRKFWGARALHVEGSPRKLADLIDAGRLEAFALGEDVKVVGPDHRGWQVETAVNPEQAAALHRMGLTLCADVSGDPQVAMFLADFRRAFRMAGGRAFAKLYASPDGCGFRPHFDKYHVFVLQLAGKKRWRFSKAPALAAPVAGGRLDPAGEVVWTAGDADDSGGDAALLRIVDDNGEPLPAPDQKSWQTVVLEPGHVLYLPPGFWHTTQAVGRSVAISVSPPRSTAFDLMGRVLGDLLMKTSAWREDVISLSPAGRAFGAAPDDVVQALGARLDDLRAALAAMDPRILHRYFMLNIQPGTVPTSEAGAPAASAIARDDVLVHAGSGSLDVLTAPLSPGGSDHLFLYGGGRELVWPVSHQELVQALARHPRFRAGEALAWAPALAWSELAHRLAELVELGWLDRV